MNRALLIFKIIILGIAAVGALALAWVYVIPGFLLGLTKMDQRHKWLPAVTAFLVVAILRLSTGTWQISLGDTNPGPWHAQIAAGILQLAIANIMVSAGRWFPGCILATLRQHKPSTTNSKA